MNRTPSSHPSPPVGEKVPGGQPRVLPASCRRRNPREALPTRRRQHLVGGTVRLVRDSGSQCMPSKSKGLFMMTVRYVLYFAFVYVVFSTEFKAAAATSANDQRLTALEKLVRDDSPRVRLEALRALAN